MTLPLKKTQSWRSVILKAPSYPKRSQTGTSNNENRQIKDISSEIDKMQMLLDSYNKINESPNSLEPKTKETIAPVQQTSSSQNRESSSGSRLSSGPSVREKSRPLLRNDTLVIQEPEKPVSPIIPSNPQVPEDITPLKPSPVQKTKTSTVLDLGTNDVIIDNGPKATINSDSRESPSYPPNTSSERTKVPANSITPTDMQNIQNQLASLKTSVYALQNDHGAKFDLRQKIDEQSRQINDLIKRVNTQNATNISVQNDSKIVKDVKRLESIVDFMKNDQKTLLSNEQRDREESISRALRGCVTESGQTICDRLTLLEQQLNNLRSTPYTCSLPVETPSEPVDHSTSCSVITGAVPLFVSRELISRPKDTGFAPQPLINIVQQSQ